MKTSTRVPSQQSEGNVALFCMPTPTSTPSEHVSEFKHLFLHCWKVPGLSLEGHGKRVKVSRLGVEEGVKFRDRKVAWARWKALFLVVLSWLFEDRAGHVDEK